MTAVVVVGRDAALWLAALALARALGPAGVRVQAVELPTALVQADLYQALPPLEALHARIGLDEAGLLRATGGAFTHGVRFAGAGAEPFLLAWGAHGTALAGEPFFPAWLRVQAAGAAAPFHLHSPTAMAALGGKLLLPDEELAAFGHSDYGYALPARGYVAALKGVAPRLGIDCHLAHHAAAERAADGTVAAVLLDGGRRLAGDLFVDAGALLAGATGWAGWAGSPATRLLVARAPLPGPVPAFAEQRATAGGWLRLHATRNALHLVHASAGGSDEAAAQDAQRAAGLPLHDASARPLRPARAARAWTGNVIALGEAAARLDPALGLDLHWAQLGVVHLLSLFPAGAAPAPAERAEYDRRLFAGLDRLLDAQAATYALAPWSGAFWDRARAGAVSATLAHSVATFRARGEVPPHEDEVLAADEWRALLLGSGIRPESWAPAADRADPAASAAALAGMRAFAAAKAAAAPALHAHLHAVAGRR